MKEIRISPQPLDAGQRPQELPKVNPNKDYKEPENTFRIAPKVTKPGENLEIKPEYLSEGDDE